MYRRLRGADDGSDGAARAPREAVRLARCFHAELHVALVKVI